MTNQAVTAIKRSVCHNEIVTVEWTAAVELALLAECDDSVETGSRLECWGTTNDGEEWRVHVDITDRATKVEAAIRSLASQDQSGEVDDSYARSGDALDTILRWYDAGRSSGDRDLVDLIDCIGVAKAAAIYAEARV